MIDGVQIIKTRPNVAHTYVSRFISFGSIGGHSQHDLAAFWHVPLNVTIRAAALHGQSVKSEDRNSIFMTVNAMNSLGKSLYVRDCH